MPDTRRHRGPHPDDRDLFSDEALPRLRSAAADLAWLLDRGYSSNSSLKLVGDRHALQARQRTAVARCVCTSVAKADRQQRELPLEELAGQVIDIDGYNVLTTVEAALADGVILRAQDGCYRDMASMHGTYRQVTETLPAIGLALELLVESGVSGCTWYLDRPVSNSGRLKGLLLKSASENGCPFQVELVDDADKILVKSSNIVATADSAILDSCGSWFNLARRIVETRIPLARVMDLSLGP